MEKRSFYQVLIIDDEPNMLEMLASVLRKEKYVVETAINGSQGIKLVEQNRYDFILCDLKMPVMDGLQFLEEINKRKIDTTLLIMSAFATVDNAVRAMKAGAYDVITKPFKIEEILCILEKAKERVGLKIENKQLRQRVVSLEKKYGFNDIVGNSKEIKDAIELARRVAKFDTTVLITGESGTGKELFARGIHEASGRSTKPFVSINCGAIPENLLESEFFGYVKGAFTGAGSSRKGLFESAQGGTLLLDEIGELPLGLQVKLLRVLQEREIRPLGSSLSKSINVRVLAATAKNLKEEVEKRSFREDLFFRINVVEIKLPNLKSRKGDIALLSEVIAAEESTRLRILIKGIAKEAHEIMAGYSWPGNVRELKNVIEHAVIYNENGWITFKSLPTHLLSDRAVNKSENFNDLLSIKQGKAVFEKLLIEKALMKTSGNKLQAAEILEISYPSMLSKIKEYGIKPACDNE